MRFVFNKEIVTLGLRRGGIHGMLVWMCGRFDDSYMVHLNTRLRGFKDWYSFSEKTHRFTKSEISFLSGLKKESLPLEFYINSVEQSTPKRFVDIDNKNYNRKKKNITKAVKATKFSKSRKYVILLRNPFNNLASLMQARENSRYPDSWFVKEIKLFRKNWIAYSKEVVGETNYLKKKIVLVYDKWVTSEEYRRQKAEEIRLDFNDKNFGKMPHAGSSFDDFVFSNNAYNMNVCNRWLKYKDNAKFNKILFDDELLNLYKKIFGEIPYSL